MCALHSGGLPTVMLRSHLHLTRVYTAAFSKPETRIKQKQTQQQQHNLQTTTTKKQCWNNIQKKKHLLKHLSELLSLGYWRMTSLKHYWRQNPFRRAEVCCLSRKSFKLIIPEVYMSSDTHFISTALHNIFYFKQVVVSASSCHCLEQHFWITLRNPCLPVRSIHFW